jgi:hypothetical protein
VGMLFMSFGFWIRGRLLRLFLCIFVVRDSNVGAESWFRVYAVEDGRI